MNGDISLTGVSATNTLEGFAQQVLTQQASQSSNYTAQQTASDNYRDSVQQSLSNSDGVDLDTEVSNLTVYEHSYAASAQVITTVNQMMTDLFNAISSVSTG
jgi:flagellar hook-associated protein 1 FlgK